MSLENKMIETMKRIGLSGDYESRYRTDSEEYRRADPKYILRIMEEGIDLRSKQAKQLLPRLWDNNRRQRRSSTRSSRPG